jgi:hypothetical protein
MALVRLSDAIVPETFTAYMTNDTMTSNDIFRSGLVSNNAMMASLLSGGGLTYQTPRWTDLADTGSSIGTDNPADIIVPDKIGSFKTQFRRQFRTKAWSSADLVAELAGSDPMQRIVSRVTPWWGREFEQIAIATLNGIINSNIANNAADMVYASGVGISGAAPTAALDHTAVLNAKQSMGDKASMLKLMVIHSLVHTNLQKQNLNDNDRAMAA